MRQKARITAFCIFVQAAAAQCLPGGFMEEIKGTVKLNSVNNSQPTKPEAGMVLCAGDSLSWESGSSILIYLGDGKRRLGPGPGTFKIVRVETPIAARSPSTVTTYASNNWRALEAYGIRGGRDKASDSPIFSPPEGGAVMPSKFVIRWRVRPPLGRLTIVLRDGKGAELWQQAGVDGASGELDVPAAREALISYRDRAGSAPEARLVFQDVSGGESGVKFLVLTREQEIALADELLKVDSTARLFHHVQRAAVYDSYKMFDMVAAEYDAALASAPNSRDMLRAALNAYTRTGDLHRARELRQRLQAVEEPAEDRD